MAGYSDFEAAFHGLFARAYRHALRLVGEPALAEDLASEALARTYAHWRRVRGYDHLDAWVLRVVTNLAIDAFAKKRPVPSAVAVPTPEDAVVLRVALAQAPRAVAPERGDVTQTFKHTYDKPGRYYVTITVVSNPCSPYTSSAYATVTIVVR